MKQFITLKPNGKNYTDIEIEIKYRRDPLNAPRGYYIYIHPVTRAGGMISYFPCDGIRALLKPVSRASAGAEKSAVNIADINAARLVSHVLNENGLELSEPIPAGFAFA